MLMGECTTTSNDREKQCAMGRRSAPHWSPTIHNSKRPRLRMKQGTLSLDMAEVSDLAIRPSYAFALGAALYPKTPQYPVWICYFIGGG